MILKALQKMKWHRGNSAELLQIPRRTLQRKMHKYGLQSP
jgi:transcriptional regulator of acetoin/glycerol metabolism